MTLPRLYADPALYDLIHADGTGDEVWLLDSIEHQLEVYALGRRGWELLHPQPQPIQTKR